MTHIIFEPCIGVKDTSCVDVCPVDCIYGKDEEDWDMLYIHPEDASTAVCASTPVRCRPSCRSRRCPMARTSTSR